MRKVQRQDGKFNAPTEQEKEDIIVMNTSKGLDGLLFDMPKKKEPEAEVEEDKYDAEKYKQTV